MTFCSQHSSAAAGLSAALIAIQKPVAFLLYDINTGLTQRIQQIPQIIPGHAVPSSFCFCDISSVVFLQHEKFI